MHSLNRAYRPNGRLVLLALCVAVAGCSGSTNPAGPTTTGTAPPSAAPLDTPADVVEALGAAWGTGNEAALAELVPASASELLGWGRPESVIAVSIPDCGIGSSGTGRCELLVAIDGFGLLFDMTIRQEPEGGVRIDHVTFAGDAG